MSRTIELSYPARYAFLELPNAVATRLARVLVRVAQGQIDEVEKVPNSRLFQVRVRGAMALFAADRGTTSVFVLHIFRE